jgi:hypothetical protein
MLYVESGEKVYLLDATDRFVPAGLIPENSLNERGFIMGEQRGFWVDIPANNSCEKSILCDLTVGEGGGITGNVTYKRANYAASRFRKRMDGFNSQEEYLDDFEKENGGCRVSGFQVSQLDSLYLPVVDKYTVEIKNKSTLIGNMLYLEPVLFERITENPFRHAKREYPVDFTCPHSVMYTATFTLPETFSIEEIPEPCRLIIWDKSASFFFQVVPLGKRFQVICQYSIDKPIYLQEEYPDLKEFYDQIVMKLAQPVVFNTRGNEN